LIVLRVTLSSHSRHSATSLAMHRADAIKIENGDQYEGNCGDKETPRVPFTKVNSSTLVFFCLSQFPFLNCATN
jgi:hypothetical protein